MKRNPGDKRSKTQIISIALVIAISVSLNLYSFFQALPETQRIDSGCCAPSGTLLAKDFSAFYFGAWNLFHNPSAIYNLGSTANATFLGITPHPETYKYLPTFLILIAPFLALGYQEALLAFDIVQFILVVLLAYLIYKILEGKDTIIVYAISIIALLLPFSTNLNWGISQAYFWQWAEGQSKVLELTLIMFSMYFGLRKKTILSAVFFGLAFFDPRFGLISIPLFVMSNLSTIKRSSLIVVLVLLITNLPIFLIPGVASGFLMMLLTEGLSTPLYYYAYIPLVTIIALSIANWREIRSSVVSLRTTKTKVNAIETTNDVSP